jgi:hypothetical protein
MSFWIANHREATQKRLEESRGEDQGRYALARSDWDMNIIEERRDSWNDDVLTDICNGLGLAQIHSSTSWDSSCTGRLYMQLGPPQIVNEAQSSPLIPPLQYSHRRRLHRW